MELGQKLRTLRKQAGWKLKDMAKRSGLSMGTISRIERGRYLGPLKTHTKLCETLGISLAQLYQETSVGGIEPVPLSPSSEDAETFTYDEKASAVLLAKDVAGKTMLPQLIVLQAKGKTHTEQLRVGSERWLFVLEGAVEVNVGGQRYPLARHGTLYFKASVPHQLINPGTEVAQCISVTSPVGL